MEKNESLPKINRNTKQQSVPKQFRRLERARKNRDAPKKSDGKVKDIFYTIMGLMNWHGQPIFFPKNKKLKGWQKENRKYRKAA